jgi:Mitochondrial carrier protein.
MLRLLIGMCIFSTAKAWVSRPQSAFRQQAASCRSQVKATQQYKMLPDAAISIIAGSIAGAVGVGAAYPLDTIKTKQQVDIEIYSNIEYDVSSTGEVSIIAAASSNNDSLLPTVLEIWKNGGLGGFYGGVQTSMIGQAIIKAAAFGVNAAALDAHYSMVHAAAIAGFITAFLAVPVDRVKVLMQTDSYKSEHECLKSVLENEGLGGLLFTGLVPTLFREVPAYTLYFFLYGALMSSATETLGVDCPSFLRSTCRCHLCCTSASG